MNTYVTLACTLAVFGLSQGNPVGSYGHGIPWVSTPIIAPAAISTANVVKAAPIPIIRTHLAPVITTPIVTAPVLRTVAYGSYGGLGDHGLGWGRYGWNNRGNELGGYGLGGYGLGGYGLGGYGLGHNGHGYGWGRL